MTLMAVFVKADINFHHRDTEYTEKEVEEFLARDGFVRNCFLSLCFVSVNSVPLWFIDVA